MVSALGYQKISGKPRGAASLSRYREKAWSSQSGRLKTVWEPRERAKISAAQAAGTGGNRSFRRDRPYKRGRGSVLKPIAFENKVWDGIGIATG